MEPPLDPLLPLVLRMTPAPGVEPCGGDSSPRKPTVQLIQAERVPEKGLDL